MKRLTKKTVCIALLLCVTGLLVVMVSFMAVGFDVKQLGTVTYVTNTYEMQDDFSNITIETQTADIRFVLWDEDGCKVVCYEEENVKHGVKVQKDTLMITVTDTRKWYDHIGMSFEDAEMTVYLPKEQYEKLQIKSGTGEVELPEVLAFEEASVETDTGDVIWKASVNGGVTIVTDTGDVSIDSVANVHPVSVETNTGEIRIDSVTCRTLTVKSDTGEIFIKDTVAAVSGRIISETGDVTFENSDAVESLYIKTDTGDVTGTLLSGKQFQTETDTGNVDVPATTGYPCVIVTDTGDINIEVVGN